MTVCSDIADYTWLTGDEACVVLDELASDSAPLHAVVARLRGRLSPKRTHLVLEQVDLRRRAAAKFSRAARMFFTRVGLEQATDEWVAAYKAARFADQHDMQSSAPWLADLCCGIGGDLQALAGQGRVTGVDSDPIAAHFAAVNANAQTNVSDAIDFDVTGIRAWHIDPDRRAGGKRTTSLDRCRPDIAQIDRLLAQTPHAAVKLAPASRVPESWAATCELEWISRARECRQLVAWHGDLAYAPGKHCATILPTDCDSMPRRIIGPPNQSIVPTERVEAFVFDFDPAVLAAGLKGALAAEHDLFALGAGPTYFTGPRPIDDRAFSCFEVAAVLPLQPRKLTEHLRKHGIGKLEIKKRGIDIDPEGLRRDLKLRGDHQASVLITAVAGRPAAIIAYRYSSHSPSATIG